MSLLVKNAKVEFWVKVVTTGRNYIFNKCFRKVIYLAEIILPYEDDIRM